MGSTRVELRLAADDRNVARMNTADVPASLYVPNQGAATLAPLKTGKGAGAAWTIPNATFPMPGVARWWTHGRWGFNASTEALTMAASTILLPFSVARTCVLLQVAYFASSISSATSTIDTAVYQQQLPSDANYFGAIQNVQTTAGTTTTGIRYSQHNLTLQPGVFYCLGMGGSGYAITGIRSPGAPSTRPLSGTYGPGANATNAVAWQNASQSIPYLAGQRPGNVGTFYWNQLNFSNSQLQPAVSFQLRTV